MYEKSSFEQDSIATRREDRELILFSVALVENLKLVSGRSLNGYWH